MRFPCSHIFFHTCHITGIDTSGTACKRPLSGIQIPACAVFPLRSAEKSMFLRNFAELLHKIINQIPISH